MPTTDWAAFHMWPSCLVFRNRVSQTILFNIFFFLKENMIWEIWLLFLTDWGKHIETLFVIRKFPEQISYINIDSSACGLWVHILLKVCRDVSNWFVIHPFLICTVEVSWCGSEPHNQLTYLNFYSHHFMSWGRTMFVTLYRFETGWIESKAVIKPVPLPLSPNALKPPVTRWWC